MDNGIDSIEQKVDKLVEIFENINVTFHNVTSDKTQVKIKVRLNITVGNAAWHHVTYVVDMTNSFTFQTNLPVKKIYIHLMKIIEIIVSALDSFDI